MGKLALRGPAGPSTAGPSALRSAATCLLALLVWAGAARPSDLEEQAASSDAPKATILKAPDFTAKDLRGQMVALAPLLKEGPVFLHFWTSWCQSCQREMMGLDRLDRKYRDKGFHVLAIAEDDPRTVQKVKPLVNSKKLKMSVIVDTDKEIGNRYNVRQYPTAFLIAKDGSIVRFAQGYLPGDEEKLEEQVRGLLGLGPESGTPGKAK